MSSKKILHHILASGLLFFLAGAAHAAELRMDKSVCQLMHKHVPDADVAYQPGVDVDGKRVAPADLTPSQHLEDQVVIRLTNDAAKAFGLKVPEVIQNGEKVPLANLETNIGFITLHDGKAYLNDKPLDASAEDELAVLCMEKK